ncbi:MAG TPA: hypothetical protein VD736_06215 [Nitrososphaera sp.]|nr:hypothetical protein [Nitrososphaera sp.]
MESLTEKKMDAKLENLLNQFEREVASYDKLSGLSMFVTPAGVVISIFVPLLLSSFSVISELALYWIVGGILASVGLAKVPLFYVDHKKHEISRTKYKPIAGVCMCDLSQYKSQMTKVENSKTMGERIRHMKLANYYKSQMGWK